MESGSDAGQMRIWTDRSGNYRVEAVVTRVDREQIYLRKADGKVIAVTIDRLSDADRAYLKTEGHRPVDPAIPAAPGAVAAPAPAQKEPSGKDVRGDVQVTGNYIQVNNPDGSHVIIPVGDARSIESGGEEAFKASLQQGLNALRKNHAAQGLNGDVADALNPDRFDTEKQEEFVKGLVAFGDISLQFREKPSEELARKMDAVFAELRQKKTIMTDGIAVLRQVYRGQATPMKPGDDAWNEHMEGLKKWHDWLPNSSTPLVLMALTEIDRGWMTRGTGFAGTVTEEMAAGFQTHLQKAKEYLDAAAKLSNDDPEIYRALIDVAKGLGSPRDEAYGYFAKGVECDSGYYDLYQAMAQYLLPRWHGIPGELPAFALMVSKNLEGERGLIAYARIAQTHCSYDLPELTNYQLDRLAEAAPVIVRRFPHSLDILGFACRSAYFGGDHETARELLKALAPDAPVTLFGGIHEQVLLSLSPEWPQKREKFLLWHDGWSGVGTIDLNASGTRMASASYYRGCPLKLWNAVTRQSEGMAPIASGPAFDARFSSQDTYLAIARRTPEQVELLADSQVRTLKLPKLCANAVAFSPDEKTLLASTGVETHAWDTATGKELWSAEVTPPKGTGCISPDGKWLLAQTGEGVVLVDVRTGKTEYELPKFDQLVGFAADDSVIGIQLGALVQWTRDSGQIETRIKSFREEAIGYSAAHGLVASALGSSEEAAKRGNPSAHAVSLWSLAAGGRIARFLGHSGLVKSAAITPDRRFLISGSLDGSIRYWEIPATDQIMAEEDDDSAPAGKAPNAGHELAGEPRTFLDANLEAAVRKALNRPAGKLTPEVLATVTELNASNKGISSLQGLEACTNLQSLHLSLNRVRNLSPLQSLPHLQNLDLSDNRIGSVQPLAGLVELEYLLLEGNDIHDIRWLSQFHKLRMLHLNENPIGDISALKELRDLHELMLTNCRVTSLAPLATLDRLRTLVLAENPIEDIAPLSKLVQLKSLNLCSTKLNELEKLSKLVGLTSLIVENNSIRDVAPIAGLPNLTQLLCSENQITDLGALVKEKKFGEGHILHVRNNPLTPECLKDQIPALKARGVTVDIE